VTVPVQTPPAGDGYRRRAISSPARTSISGVSTSCHQASPISTASAFFFLRHQTHAVGQAAVALFQNTSQIFEDRFGQMKMPVSIAS